MEKDKDYIKSMQHWFITQDVSIKTSELTIKHSKEQIELLKQVIKTESAEVKLKKEHDKAVRKEYNKYLSQFL